MCRLSGSYDVNKDEYRGNNKMAAFGQIPFQRTNLQPGVSCAYNLSRFLSVLLKKLQEQISDIEFLKH